MPLDRFRNLKAEFAKEGNRQLLPAEMLSPCFAQETCVFIDVHLTPLAFAEV